MIIRVNDILQEANRGLFENAASHWSQFAMSKKKKVRAVTENLVKNTK